jgi:hypothetical protein
MGGELAEQGARFPSRRSARQAASELAGDLGPEAQAIRAFEFRGGPKSWENSTRVIGRQNASGTAGWRDDVLGHQFKDRYAPPHVNAWADSFEFHFWY